MHRYTWRCSAMQSFILAPVHPVPPPQGTAWAVLGRHPSSWPRHIRISCDCKPSQKKLMHSYTWRRMAMHTLVPSLFSRAYVRALVHLIASCHANNRQSKIIKTERTLLRQRREHTSESKVLGDRPTVVLTVMMMMVGGSECFH